MPSNPVPNGFPSFVWDLETSTVFKAVERWICSNLTLEATLAMRSLIALTGSETVLREHLNQMHTVSSKTVFLDPIQEHKFASILTDVYAPLSERMGLENLKKDFENTGFSKASPQLLKEYFEKLDVLKLESFLGMVYKASLDVLGREGYGFVSSMRVKSPYSALKKAGWDVDVAVGLHDLAGVRIVVESEQDCYAVSSLLTSFFSADLLSYKDYIRQPKESGYKSIHFVYRGGDYPVEFQVRSREHHLLAQSGDHAHWAYKSGSFKEPSWVSKMLSGLPYPGEIIVFSPLGHAYTLPVGSTVIDFAYRVHTQVGNLAVGATVNGSVAKLVSVLSDGDTVEVRLGKRSAPNKDWLLHAHTPYARSKIRRALKEVSDVSLDKPAALGKVVSPGVSKTAPAPGRFEENVSTVNVLDFVDSAYTSGLPLKVSKCCLPQYGKKVVCKPLRSGVLSLHDAFCVNVDVSCFETGWIPIKTV